MFSSFNSAHLLRYVPAVYQRSSLTHCCIKPHTSRQHGRGIHQSVSTSEVITSGCEKLPDLTVVWPFHLWPSDVAATAMEQIQASTTLPWWSTILISGAIIKLPLYGWNIFNYRRVQQFIHSSPKLNTNFVLTYLNNLVTKGEHHALKMANDERRFTLMRDGSDMHQRFTMNMFSHISYLPLYAIAAFHVSMLGGLHWLNRIIYVPLITGGLPWCLNLTVADPYVILPAICVITGCLNFYLHPVHWMLPVPEFQLKHFKAAGPAIAVTFILLSSLPADFVLYMISMNLTSCLLNTLLKQPMVYNEVGLLSSGEVFNRTIPQGLIFKELGKTLDRQQFLLEQKKEQMLLLESKKQLKLKDSEPVKLLGESTDESVDNTNAISKEVERLRFVKQLKNGEINNKPHLNVKKVFK